MFSLSACLPRSLSHPHLSSPSAPVGDLIPFQCYCFAFFTKFKPSDKLTADSEILVVKSFLLLLAIKYAFLSGLHKLSVLIFSLALNNKKCSS